MSNMVIVAPLAWAAQSVNVGTGVDFVATPDPKEAWVSGGASTTATFELDLGSAQQFDSIFVGFVAGPAAPTFTLKSGVAASTETTHFTAQSVYAPSSLSSPLRRHLFRRLAAPVTHRYVQFAFAPGAAVVASIGVIAVGLAFQPTYNREKGGGRRPIDTRRVERLASGGFGSGPGVTKRGFRWTLGDLSDAELDQLEWLALDRGNADPVIVVEDPDLTTGLNERICYGVFDQFEFYERGDPSKHRWGLGAEEWV